MKASQCLLPRFAVLLGLVLAGPFAAVPSSAQDPDDMIIPELPDGTIPTPEFPSEPPVDQTIPNIFRVLQHFQPMGSGLPMGDRPAGLDRFRLRMSDGSLLVGQFAGDAKIKITTRFAEVTLPIKDVARIDPAAEEKKWTVALGDGDRLTGTVDFAAIALKTPWGEVPLKPADLLALEAGKLYQQQIPFSRPSPDGRTTITVYRAASWFEPARPAPEGTPQWDGTSNTYYPNTAYPDYSTHPMFQAPGSP